jgi:hypothetical protein
MDMPLLSSLLLGIGLLSVRLIIQSRALTATDVSKKDKLAKKIQGVTYVILGFGLAMLIAGCIQWNLLRDSYIPFGSVLIVASITFLVQSKSLTVSGDEAVRFGRFVKVWAWIVFGAVIVGFGFFIFFLIKMALIWH